MLRFLLGLALGLAAGYAGADYWLKRREAEHQQEEQLIEIDQIPLPPQEPVYAARKHSHRKGRVA